MSSPQELTGVRNQFRASKPAEYVVAADRKVIKAFVDRDYTMGLEPEEIIAALGEIKS